jgi:hypothetical protein
MLATCAVDLGSGAGHQFLPALAGKKSNTSFQTSITLFIAGVATFIYVL